jgi:hypothetical protein
MMSVVYVWFYLNINAWLTLPLASTIHIKHYLRQWIREILLLLNISRMVFTVLHCRLSQPSPPPQSKHYSLKHHPYKVPLTCVALRIIIILRGFL